MMKLQSVWSPICIIFVRSFNCGVNPSNRLLVVYVEWCISCSEDCAHSLRSKREAARWYGNQYTRVVLATPFVNSSKNALRKEWAREKESLDEDQHPILHRIYRYLYCNENRPGDPQTGSMIKFRDTDDYQVLTKDAEFESRYEDEIDISLLENDWKAINSSEFLSGCVDSLIWVLQVVLTLVLYHTFTIRHDHNLHCLVAVISTAISTHRAYANDIIQRKPQDGSGL